MSRNLLYLIAIFFFSCKSSPNKSVVELPVDSFAKGGFYDTIKLAYTKDSIGETLHPEQFKADSTRESRLQDSVTKIIGDFDGDKRMDSAVVLPPYMYYPECYCSSCITQIVFNHNIDTIKIHYDAIGAWLYNAGDLDGNMSDELVVIPDWCNSCLGTQHVYSYTKNHWDIIAEASTYRCDPRNTIKKIKKGVFSILKYTDGQDSLKIVKLK